VRIPTPVKNLLTIVACPLLKFMSAVWDGLGWLMAAILQLSINLLSILALLSKSGSVRSLVSESLLLRQQLLITSRRRKRLPKYLSSDNGPLFKYHRWIANLDILEIESIKSIPYTPRSHPFIERLIGTVRREYLDHTLFWNERDLLRKLNQFKDYYNENRGHLSLQWLDSNSCYWLDSNSHGTGQNGDKAT